mmetsp:Transcript_5785/g.22852  ORF Transcript_5785/g.22852 Transcript_5785/m.22852 type:complete len:246 (+) Transcript_5785:695-1432(+)
MYPCTRSMRAKQSLSASAACSGSRPFSRIPSMFVSFSPSMNSIVNTRRVVKSQKTSGVSMRASSANANPSRSQFRPSASKSISFSSLDLNSSTMKPKSNDGKKSLVKRTSALIVDMSLSIDRSSPGRWILTATVRPLFNTARCTCANDAAAMGSGSNVSNSASGARPPNSFLTTFSTASRGDGATSSCSLLNRRAYASGTPPAVDANCPALTYSPPFAPHIACNRFAFLSCAPPSLRHVSRFASL